MHKPRTTLKWSKRQVKKRTREQSVMALTKKIARMTSVVAKKDLLFAETAKESVMATSTERAQVQSTGKTSSNDSSQGNNKKKRKKESPATAAKADNRHTVTENGNKRRETSVPDKGQDKENKNVKVVSKDAAVTEVTAKVDNTQAASG